MIEITLRALDAESPAVTVIIIYYNERISRYLYNNHLSSELYNEVLLVNSNFNLTMWCVQYITTETKQNDNDLSVIADRRAQSHRHHSAAVTVDSSENTEGDRITAHFNSSFINTIDLYTI